MIAEMVAPPTMSPSTTYADLVRARPGDQQYPQVPTLPADVKERVARRHKQRAIIVYIFVCQ